MPEHFSSEVIETPNWAIGLEYVSGTFHSRVLFSLLLKKKFSEFNLINLSFSPQNLINIFTVISLFEFETGVHFSVAY